MDLTKVSFQSPDDKSKSHTFKLTKSISKQGKVDKRGRHVSYQTDTDLPFPIFHLVPRFNTHLASQMLFHTNEAPPGLGASQKNIDFVREN